jgi:two-component system sensor kinase FixL
LTLVGTKDQRIRVRFQFDTAVDPVLVDKIQIQQVVLNRIRNAVEAMAASEQRAFTISTAAEDDDMVSVSVADTGSGRSFTSQVAPAWSAARRGLRNLWAAQ